MSKALFTLFFIILFTKSSVSIKAPVVKDEASDIQYEIPENDPTTIIFRGKGTLTSAIAKAAQNKKKIIIEEGVTEIEDDAFYKQIWPVTENQNFTYEEVELPRSLVKIGAHAFSISGRELKRVHFPDYKAELPENDVPEADLESFYALREIGADAFARQPLTDHNIPGTFTEIGTRAFEMSQLTHIRLNSKLKVIPAYAFMECEHLNEVILPISLTNVSSNAFMNCRSLKKVTWKSSEVKFFGYDAFYGCSSLEEFIFPQSGSGFQSAGEYFGNCFSLKRVVFPRKLAGNSLAPSVFVNCYSLHEVVLPDGINSIPAEFFMNSSIETAFLPDSVSSIGSKAFKDCKKLRYVYVSNKMELSIDADSFVGADNIEKMVFDGDISILNPNVFVAQIVCYNGVMNPHAYSDYINTTKTKIYLTEKFRESNHDQNFGHDESSFTGFPYEIQQGDTCSLPTPQPVSSSQDEEQSTNENNNNNNEGDSSKKGMSTLTIVLIVVCCVAALAIIAVIVTVVLAVKKRRNSQYPNQESTNENL